jgi:hypothetical protein
MAIIALILTKSESFPALQQPTWIAKFPTIPVFLTYLQHDRFVAVAQ